ncbi:MAG TPA: DUF6770 family protein, partial [Nitrosopumilaceae archaeon]|nr:DUF6770 family protein [Nitrosopumilaceae archaeon]
MKKFLYPLFSSFLIALNCFPQAATFDNVKTLELRKFSVLENNSEVNGYFMFYFLDKASKKEDIYALIILDNNLKQTSYLELKKSNEVTLLASAFNGQ